MNILKHELRQNLVSTIVWTFSLIFFIGFFISLYPSIAENSGMDEIINNFPEAFRKIIGFSEGSFSTFPPFYTMGLQLVTLVGAVQAMSLGTGIVSKEVQGKTAEFLLTKPVSRFRVLTSKLTAVVFLITLTNLLFLTITWGLIQQLLNVPFSFETYLISTSTFTGIQFFFLGLGFLLGAVLPKVKSVVAVALPTVFCLYIVSMFDTLIGEDKIKFLTPFKFQDLADLVRGGEYDPTTLIYLMTLVTAMIIVSYLYYQRKDVHTT